MFICLLDDLFYLPLYPKVISLVVMNILPTIFHKLLYFQTLGEPCNLHHILFAKKVPVSSHLEGKVELFWAYISTTSYFENSSQNTHMLVFCVYELKYHVDSVLKKMCLRHVYSSCLILLCTTVKANFWA